jgi:hypothetical protein
MSVHRLKRVLVGRPIPTSLDQHERLSRLTGLTAFASDALSSVAHTTELIFLVLIAAGTAALSASLPIIEIRPEQTRRIEERWGQFAGGMPLVVLRSPYRSVARPLLEYLDHLQHQAVDQLVTIVLPEFIPARWWQPPSHNQTALLIKGALFFRNGVIVTNVPYHLEQ